MGSFLDAVGVSIDAFDPELARTIGRADRGGNVVNPDILAEMFQTLKRCGCSVKVNTVVSDLNSQERMIETIDKLDVSRWKIFKMKEFQTSEFSNKDLL